MHLFRPVYVLIVYYYSTCNNNNNSAFILISVFLYPVFHYYYYFKINRIKKTKCFNREDETAATWKNDSCTKGNMIPFSIFEAV